MCCKHDWFKWRFVFLANIFRKYKTWGRIHGLGSNDPELNTKYDLSHHVLRRIKCAAQWQYSIINWTYSKRCRQTTVDKISYFSLGQIHPGWVKSLPGRNAWPEVITGIFWTPGGPNVKNHAFVNVFAICLERFSSQKFSHLLFCIS